MKKIIGIAFLTGLICSCGSKPKSLSSQLETNFLSRLNKVDSTIVLDSFRVIRIDTITRKMERIIDDTLYKRVFYSVQTQLANATKGKKTDSIEFYQGEVNYMITQFDSLNREIMIADTTKKLGLLATCQIQLKGNNGGQKMIIYYFLDWNMKVWNTEMIDSSISILVRRPN
jgi:hypothetical protein